MTIESWQADRERLNLEKWEFSDTARTWQSTLKQFVGVLKVIAARSSRVNLADAQSLIEVINAITGPSQYKFLPAKAVDNNKAVVLAAQEFLEREDDTQTRQVILERLALIERAGGDFSSLSDAPRRDVAAYVDDAVAKRTRDAKHALRT